MHKEEAYHRHDITDAVWPLLEPYLPEQRGQWVGIAEDNRRFINAVFWVLRAGAPWRDLSPDFGKWGTVHQRFFRWRRKVVWEKLLETLIDEPDYVRVRTQCAYICILLDLGAREIIGYSAGAHKTAELVHNASASMRGNLFGIQIFHTDRCSEFDNILIEELLESFQIRRSLSRKAAPTITRLLNRPSR